MGIIVNDGDVCPKCGAYWQTSGWCCNGHPKPDRPTVIYRVGIAGGMSGFYYEKFYTTLGEATKAFETLLAKKKKTEETLSDEDCQEYGEGEHNFEEMDGGCYSKTEKENKKCLRRIRWSYGYDQDYEGGTEFYTTTDELWLEEIIVEPP